ncbi:RluA family pseudouridine synthase [Novispirillum itersonii]|uniref:RluA family pseudouridine synthase n=1 Tax=Novispirillum itersonii TaxID=189 RepID=UPI002892A850|nr:RluA family pseudouridine synthase [Novispirillum itersonii]
MLVIESVLFGIVVIAVRRHVRGPILNGNRGADGQPLLPRNPVLRVLSVPRSKPPTRPQPSPTSGSPGADWDDDLVYAADDMADDDLPEEDTEAAPAGDPPGEGPFTLPPVSPEQAGTRLDKWLAEAAPSLSRSRLKALILDGQVSLDGVTIVDPSVRVKPAQQGVVNLPAAVPALPVPQNIPLTVVYEDDDLIVIDKPAGLVVHPAPGSPDGTLVNALLYHCGDRLSGIGGVRRPGIVHRIDKDTSGLLVVAKSDRAHHGLSAQFADKSAERAYWALVWGCPLPRAGEVEGNIGRSPQNRQKMALLRSGGKPALTRFRTLQPLCGDAVALIECRLATGRTHQIRVHLTHIGHGLIGDPMYGAGRRVRGLPPVARAAAEAFPRQALHAWLLGFTHPVTGEPMRFESPMPDDLAALLTALGGEPPL